MNYLFRILLIISLGFSSLILAQDLDGKFSLSPYGGVGLPIGDFADDDWGDNEDAAFRSTGYQFGLIFDYFFSRNFAGGIVFNYASFTSKDYDLLDEPEQDDVMTLLKFGAEGKYLFVSDGQVQPYGKFGLGLVMSSISEYPAVNWAQMQYYITDVEIDTKLYLQFGAGLQFFVGEQVSLFGEFTYDYLAMDGAKLELTDIPGAEDGEIETNYSYLSIIGGVKIWFGGNGRAKRMK